MVLAQEKIQYDQPAYAPQESPKVVRRKVRKSSAVNRAKMLAVSLLVLGFVSGIFVATQYARLALANYQVFQMKKEIAAAKAENAALQLQIGELKSVSRIESIAVNQLGMVKPDKYAYLDYQVEQKAKAPAVGTAPAEKPAEVAQQPKGNPVIQQVAQILSGIFSTEK